MLKSLDTAFINDNEEVKIKTIQYMIEDLLKDKIIDIDHMRHLSELCSDSYK